MCVCVCRVCVCVQKGVWSGCGGFVEFEKRKQTCMCMQSVCKKCDYTV